MKFVSLVASVLSLSAFVGKVSCEDDEAVYTLTDENFNAFIAEHPKVLVEFYAPWCGHCKKLAPEFEQAAQKLNADESINAVLAKVDATEAKDLASKYGVRGFPTLKYFTGGDAETPVEYTGGRTESTIVQWISQRALPAITSLATGEELDTFKSKSRVSLVSFLPENDDTAAQAKVLIEFADLNRESVVVGRMTGDDVISSVDGVSSGDVWLYKQFDVENPVQFTGEFDLEALTSFVDSEKFPLIDAIGPENYKDYVDRGLPIVWIALDASEESDQLETVLAMLRPFASDFKGALSFTYVDNAKYAQHVGNLGITKVPGLMIVGDDKFLLKEELTTETATAFFDGYKAGTLGTHLKSEEIPESNDEDVFVLVGKNFKEVIGHDKDVFVEFYAPWCGHCKKLTPEYEQVGAAFKDVENVVVAKVDATENDTPEEIKGFPTLIFYPKGTSTGEKYNGERTADAIIEFLKTHATVDVSAMKTEL